MKSKVQPFRKSWSEDRAGTGEGLGSKAQGFELTGTKEAHELRVQKPSSMRDKHQKKNITIP